MGNQKYDAFLKVAETGSFKQAAHDLGYTQAGISYLVSTLERELDVPLFVRDYGGAHLTSDGADLLPWVQNVCNSERQLEMRLAELKHLESGIVRVAAFTSTAIQWFPGIAKRFLAQHPGIDLPREALAEEPYIRLESGTSSEMETLFRANDVEPNVRFTIDSDYAVMSMVSAGLGFSVLADLILRDAPFPLAVKQPEVETSREIAIALRSLETASTATRAFLDATQAWIADTYEE